MSDQTYTFTTRVELPIKAETHIRASSKEEAIKTYWSMFGDPDSRLCDDLVRAAEDSADYIRNELNNDDLDVTVSLPAIKEKVPPAPVA